MIEFNLLETETELRAIFPALHIPTPLQVIGSGFNSLVLEAGGAIVFRIGKNSIAQQGYEKERACLSILASQIPFLIPNPKWFLKSSAYFPFGIIGYDKIPGVPLPSAVPDNSNLSSLASDTARFLFALHHIPPDSLPLKNIMDHDSKWNTLCQMVLPTLKAQLITAEFSLVKHWWDDFLADKKMQAYHPRIQHGDLWYENILVDPKLEQLTGVIDWEKLSIGDPAQDFATLFHSGETLVRRVMLAYQSLGGKLDQNFEYRMQRLWAAREFDGLQHAIQCEDRLELDDALQKLRRGPILKFRKRRRTKSHA